MEVTNKKHPVGLYTLFATEFWERFSYYGMRALLVLYLTETLIGGGFGMDRSQALEIYGIFTGLVYLTPILGGLLADKILGQRKAIFIGGIVMAIGQFTLASSVSYDMDGDMVMRNFLLYCGLGFLIVGNGFFKPNISTMVGGLYDTNDPRKDSAFTIFYMGINLGAFLSPFIAGGLGQKIGWHYGYISAGVGMLIGLAWFYVRRVSLDQVGLPPQRPAGQTSLVFKDLINILTYSLAIILFVIGFIKFIDLVSETVLDVVIWSAAFAGALYLLTSIWKGTEGKAQWSRVFVIIVLAVFHMIFWSGFEQAGGTFNLFAAQNTNRMVLGWDVPASWFQALNPVFIVTLAPLFSMMWIALAGMGKNPRTPFKFSFGLLLLGLGFIIMTGATSSAEGGVLVSPLWLVAVYFFHTAGELCLSPVGLSMITKLSPPKIVSAMMGLWMGSIALGNYLAATMEAILEKFDLSLYPFIATEALVASAILMLLSPILSKLMHGIH
ncbi:MAG: peptide MFS transporter [Cyclobacteriaceae bacterium]|nr:peptide MFS transporter [Cyclobacteriaceae bacterium]